MIYRQRFVILLLVLLTAPVVGRAATPCASTSLGHNWTCVAGDSHFSLGGSNTFTVAVTTAIQVGDLLWACPASRDTGTYSVSDNADSIAWTLWPPGVKGQLLNGAGGTYACFYHIATIAKASGYQYTETISGSNVLDWFGWAQFRNSLGTTAGIENTLTPGGCTTTGCSIFFTNNPTATSSFSGGITTNTNGALILGTANMEAVQTSMAANWTPVDQSSTPSGGTCSLSSVPFCYFAAITQATAGAITWTWTAPSADYETGIVAFDPPASSSSVSSVSGGAQVSGGVKLQ